MEGDSVWFVPKNGHGGYHVAVEIKRDGNNCWVFVRSGVGMYDRGIMQDLESLMEIQDIRYIIGRKPTPLQFDVAVEFMKKKTALKMVE